MGGIYLENKLKLYAKRLENNIESVKALEDLRFQAYELPYQFEQLTFYSIRILEGYMLPYGLYVNNQLVAGCYVSANNDSLYIEQLFVHPSLQNSGLRFGRLLLNFVLLNREEIENYFGQEFEVSSLEPSNDKARAIYESIGYIDAENCMQKKLFKRGQ